MNNDFEELYRQTHWNTPVFFDNAQYGVVYKNPKSNTVEYYSENNQQTQTLVINSEEELDGYIEEYCN
jgi:hypothetical protein